MDTLHSNAAWLTVPTPNTRRPKSSDGSTKPLRSSPLTGPALNPSLVAFPAPTLNNKPTAHPHHRSSQNFDSSSAQPFSDPSSSSPTMFRRSSHGSLTNGIRGSGRSQSLYLPSTFDTTAKRTAAAMPEWEIDSLQNPIPPRTSKSRLRPQTSSGIPSFRRPIPIVEEEADQVDPIEPLSKDISNTSTSPTRDNSWYTANPYDVTPRFSRLGLSASNVVMPLSVKEHRRLSSATSSNNSTSPILRRFSIKSPTSPKSPPKSPPKSLPIFPPAAPTRITLRPRSPPFQLPHSYAPPEPRPLSRSISIMSSSETSSIASTPQRETPTPTSISISISPAPSLTRSGCSGDSLSTGYESCLPTPPELDEILSPEHSGEECEGEKGEVDGEDEEIAGVGEFRRLHGHHDRDHQIKYSDITLGNDSADDKTQPGKDLVLDSITIEQPKTFPQSDPQPQVPQSTPPPTLSPSIPKEMEKGRDSQQKTLVRIKLQSVGFNDFEAVRSLSTVDVTTMKTISTTTMETLATAEADVGLDVGSAVVPPLVTVTVGSEKNTPVDVPPLLPTLTLKKRPSKFKCALKSFVKRW